MKRAIVYDWIDTFGGAERLLGIIFGAYPTADIYTLFTRFERARWAVQYRSRIYTSYLQPLYSLCQSKPLLTPFMPRATESLPLDAYDEVLSVTSSFVKGINTKAHHVSYVFTPTRFLWDQKQLYQPHKLFSPLIDALRKWDVVAATKPNTMLTLSHFSQKAIKRTYGRNAKVLYPPFSTTYFTAVKQRARKINMPPQYFLFVGRLEPYKRVDILLKIFKERPAMHLVIVGTGTQERMLKKITYGVSNIHFFSNITDEELAYIYQKATATILPQYEDFGYVTLESLFFDTPVITVSESGAAEIVKMCGGGIVSTKQTVHAIGGIVDIFHTLSYTINHRKIEMFDREVFLKKLRTEFEK